MNEQEMNFFNEVDEQYIFFIDKNLLETILGWFNKKFISLDFNEKIIFTFLYTLFCWTEVISSKNWYVVDNYIKAYNKGGNIKNFFWTHTKLYKKRFPNKPKFDNNFNYIDTLNIINSILREYKLTLNINETSFKEVKNILESFNKKYLFEYIELFDTQFYFDFIKNIKLLWIIDIDFHNISTNDFYYDYHTKHLIEDYFLESRKYLDNLWGKIKIEYINKWYKKDLYWVVVESALCIFWSNI